MLETYYRCDLCDVPYFVLMGARRDWVLSVK